MPERRRIFGRRSSERQGIVAAATRYAPGEKAPPPPKPSRSADRNWSFYDGIGAIHYSLNYRANILSRVELFVEDRDGNRAPDEMQALLDPLRGQSGSFADPLRRASVNFDVAGECYLLTRRTKMPPTEEGSEGAEVEQSWIVSTAAVEVRAGIEGAVDTWVEWEPGSEKKKLEAGEDAIRMWMPHPRHWLQADPLLTAIEAECEEYISQNLAARALSLSRAASNGIALVDQDISFRSDPSRAGDAKVDDFMQELIEAAHAKLRDPGSPSAAFPLIGRIPGDRIENAIKFIKFHEPSDRYPDNAYVEALLKRMAIGINVPAEIITGLADVNHWTAWLVDDQSWYAHIEPTAITILDAWTVGYLRPRISLGLDPDRWRVGYDASKIIQGADRSEIAIAVYDRGEISGDTLRAETGYRPEHAGDGIHLNAAAPAADAPEQPGPPAVRAAATPIASDNDRGMRLAFAVERARERIWTLMENAADDLASAAPERHAPILDAFQARLDMSLRRSVGEMFDVYGQTIDQAAINVDHLVAAAAATARALIAAAVADPGEDGRPNIPVDFARVVLQVAGGAQPPPIRTSGIAAT